MTDERAAVELNIPTGDFEYHEWCRKALPEWWALYGSTYGDGCSAVRVDRSQIGFRPVDFSQAALVEIVALRAENERLKAENASLKEANEIDLGEKAPLIFENTELSARVSELTRLLAEAEAAIQTHFEGERHPLIEGVNRLVIEVNDYSDAVIEWKVRAIKAECELEERALQSGEGGK